MKKLLFLIIIIFSLSTYSFSQELNISTKFIQNGDLYDGFGKNAQTWTKFKKNKDCIVLEYLGRSKYKIKYEKWIGYVTYEYILINEEIEQAIKEHEKNWRIDSDNRKKEQAERIKLMKEKRLNRELRQKETQEKELKLKDSIKKVNDSINLIELKTKCHYKLNEIDEFDHVKIVKTKNYWISDRLQIELYKKGNSKYVFFNLIGSIGCASHYKNDRSFVKVKLENNDIVIFYHSWDIDCDSFNLKANLTNSDIIRLKKSSIKTIRLQGTKHYRDIQNIEYKNFFIDKLKCLN